MDMRYMTLRKQLDDLGYKENFPMECISLVESLTADLLQTTKSLQHYMSLSKETLKERDTLKVLTDPYVCDNTKLVKENNQLHLELVTLKEECEISFKKLKSKVRKLDNEVSTLEFENRNLRMRSRDYELRNLRADTFSSRSKYVTNFTRPCCSQDTKTPKTSDEVCTCDKKQCCICLELQNQISLLSKSLDDCKDKNSQCDDTIDFLKQQLDNRDKENTRLRKLLEGGRPIAALQKDCCGKELDRKLVQMYEEIHEYEKQIESLNSQLKDSLDKQHEAMNRAIKLADRNKVLETELRNIDQLALRIECDSNETLRQKCDLIIKLQHQLETAKKDYSTLQNELMSLKENRFGIQAEFESHKNENDALKIALTSGNEVKERLLKENKMLLEANRKLEMQSIRESQRNTGSTNGNKSKSPSHVYQNGNYQNTAQISNETSDRDKAAKDELLAMLEKERQLYEKQINDVKKQLAEVNRFHCKFNKPDQTCYSCEKLRQERDFYQYEHKKKAYPSEGFVAELKNKISDLEQHVQCLKKQNEVLNDNNQSLKMVIEQNKVQHRSHHHDDVENCLQLSINKLERELKRANIEIQSLEEEKHHLKCKLKASMTSVREKYYRDTPSPNHMRDREIDNLKQEIDRLREKLKSTESELIHTKSTNNQLKNMQLETDRNIASARSQSYDTHRELQTLREQVKILEKNKFDLEHELLKLKSEKMSLRDNVSKIDQDRDKLIMDIDDKTERLASFEHDLRSKVTTIEMLENKIRELNKKMDLSNTSNASLEHRWRDSQTRNEALSIELDSVAKERDSALIENKRLQCDLATVTNDLRSVNREYENARKEVEQMKAQLQHYVDEVRRIEEILSRKEAERTEMLDHFASLSHEATVLESNNHSLENETASKSVQLQVTFEKLGEIEKKLESRESLIDMQEEKMSKLIYNISKLESELSQQKELTKMAEKNLEYARETCATLEKQKKAILIGVGETDSEKKKLEYNLRVLREEKSKVEENYCKDRATVESLESLLNTSRREVVELKVRLQESIEETRVLKEKVDQLQNRLRKVEGESSSSRQRAEEAAKNLQELQWQINDQRFQRARSTEHHHLTSSRQHMSTL